MNNSNFTIISFYQFIRLRNLNKLKKLFTEFCSFHKLRGTILIAPEGINGAIAGLSETIQQFHEYLYSKKFNKLELKYSYHKYMPFNRLKIKIKKEIITFSNIKLDVEKNTATYVKPEDWNSLIENKDTLVLDVRNDFENELGTFKNSFGIKTKIFLNLKNL